MTDVDKQAARESTWAAMNADERSGYVRGVSHAFTDVFDHITDAFAGRLSTDLSDVREALTARWNELNADFTAKGAL